MINKRLYSIWHNMKSRCTNTKMAHFDRYGGRGIKVCDDWQKFEPFYEWAMSHGYSDTLTLDRIDVDGNYEPSNCRWVDMYVQNNNKQKNHYITYKGQTKTAAEWAREYGLHRCVFNNRIRRGWSFEKAVNCHT